MSRPDLPPVDETTDKCNPFTLWTGGRAGGYGREQRVRALEEWEWWPTFTEAKLRLRAGRRGVKLFFINPGKPVHKAYIENFNGRFRDEYPNLRWFTSHDEALGTVEAWRKDDNECRPDGRQGYHTPFEFAARRAVPEPLVTARS